MQEVQQPENRYPLADVDLDDSGIDTDDDDNIKAAIERSKWTPTQLSMNRKGENDIQKATELSSKAHEELERGLSKSKTEEEIVLEYVKRQSLAEAQLKKSVTGHMDQ